MYPLITNSWLRFARYLIQEPDRKAFDRHNVALGDRSRFFPAKTAFPAPHHRDATEEIKLGRIREWIPEEGSL